jgi:hypothetical protein
MHSQIEEKVKKDYAKSKKELFTEAAARIIDRE